MSRSTKPYRRFRARGGDVEGEESLAALRELTARETGGAAPPPPPPPRGDGRIQAPPPPRAPGQLEREQKRALARAGRRPWSLRGVGPGGWIARVLVLALVGFVVWSVFGYLALNGAVKEANAKITPSARAALDEPEGGMLGTPTNTLILGVDARKGATRSKRADTILIMRTDPDSGRIKYLSIPRDWRIELPSPYFTQKINAAFTFYGQAGMIRAVKDVTGLPIHHLMVIKFSGFPKMVDAVGGITVNNPTALVDCPYEAGRTVTFPAGKLEMDGARALEYSRARQGDCGGDFGRALRQQAVVAGLKSEVVAPSQIWRAPWRGAGVIRAMQTDIGTIDMVKMGWLQARLEQRKSDRILLAGEPQLIGETSFVVQTDPDLNERQIAKFVAS